jgi:hypothetical protein
LNGLDGFTPIFKFCLIRFLSVQSVKSVLKIKAVLKK